MSRFFVLGCSFSNYAWPSWADIVGEQYDFYENWAWPGLGNRAILERLSELILVHKIHEKDTIIIQWTSHIRHDWHTTDARHGVPEGWKTSGSIFNSINKKIYNNSWLDQFWDEKSYVMHSLNCIHVAQKILNNIGCTWFMTSMGNIEKLNSDIPGNDICIDKNNIEEQNIWSFVPELKIYKEELFTKCKDKWIKPVGVSSWHGNYPAYKFLVKNMLGSAKFRTEFHPTILQHKEFAVEHVLPKLDCSQFLSPKVDIWIDKVEQCYTDCHSDFNTFVKSVGWNNQYRGF